MRPAGGRPPGAGSPGAGSPGAGEVDAEAVTESHTLRVASSPDAREPGEHPERTSPASVAKRAPTIPGGAERAPTAEDPEDGETGEHPGSGGPSDDGETVEVAPASGVGPGEAPSSAPPSAPPSAPSSPPDDPDDDEDDDSGWLLRGEDEGEPERAGAPGGPDDPTEALPRGSRRGRRRRWLWPAVAAVLVLALVGGVFFARDLIGVLFPADFDGPGTGRVVVEVTDGDSNRAIGEELATRGVVASARAFGSAAEDDPRGRTISPGFYAVRQHMSAASAVAALLDPASRLGRVEIRGGTQLDDTLGAGDAPVPGVLSLIARATCLPDAAGAEQCRSTDDVRQAMATADPAALGVPGWALDDVRRADPNRRLEGLLAPGTYDIPPGASALDALRGVMRTSVRRLEAGGLVDDAAAQHVSPYQALVVGSLLEREGVAPDFPRIARVVYNRLPIPMRLQLDSTINYPLDRQTLLTSPVDRARPGPYNTYLNFGLPPTPIGAVSATALHGALAPDAGSWLYFVKCERDGTSCFAVTPAEHDANRRLAQERGAY